MQSGTAHPPSVSFQLTITPSSFPHTPSTSESRPKITATQPGVPCTATCDFYLASRSLWNGPDGSEPGALPRTSLYPIKYDRGLFLNWLESQHKYRFLYMKMNLSSGGGTALEMMCWHHRARRRRCLICRRAVAQYLSNWMRMHFLRLFSKALAFSNYPTLTRP